MIFVPPPFSPVKQQLFDRLVLILSKLTHVKHRTTPRRELSVWKFIFITMVIIIGIVHRHHNERIGDVHSSRFIYLTTISLAVSKIKYILKLLCIL